VARQATAKATEEEAKGEWLARLDEPKWVPGIAGAVAPAVADAPAAVAGAMENQAKRGRQKRRFLMRKTRSKFFDQAKEHDQGRVDQKVKATAEALEAMQAKAKEDKAWADAAQVELEKEHRARLEAAFHAVKAAEEAARTRAAAKAEADAAAAEEEEEAKAEVAKVEEEHASAEAEAKVAVQAPRIDAEQEFLAKLDAMPQAKIKAKEEATARAEAAQVKSDKKRRARLEDAAKAKAMEEAVQVQAEKEHRAKLEAVAKAKAMEEAKARLAAAAQVQAEEAGRAAAEREAAMTQRKATLERVVTLACSAAKDVTRTPVLTEASECAILTWLDQLDEGTTIPTPAATTKSKSTVATKWTVTTQRRAKKPLEWFAKATLGIIALWTGGSGGSTI